MMAGDTTKILGLLKNIQDDNNVEDNIADLNIVVRFLDDRQLSEIVNSCPLGSLFDCLNSSNLKQIVSTCDILKTFLPLIPAARLVSEFRPALIRALGHPMVEVKLVILKELIRLAASEYTSLENDMCLLLAVQKCLYHEDVSVGSRAQNFFSQLAQRKSGLRAITQPLFVKELVDNISGSNVYAVRVFDLMTDICAKSEETLKYLEKEGLLDQLIKFLQTDDILAMLACLNVCIKLALTSHGWDFFIRHGVIKNLVVQMISKENNFYSLTFTGLCKFFQEICQHCPSVLLSEHPEVLEFAFTAIDFEEEDVALSALELIASIASSPEGKAILQKQDEKYMRHAMGKINTFMRHSLIPSQRHRAIHTLANIIYVKSEDLTPEINRLHEKWFNQLGTVSLDFLITFLRQPFKEAKEAALLVLLKMANQKWGQLKISDNHGLLELLLDRSAEIEGLFLNMKYDILKTISESETFNDSFHPGQYERILQYVQQGAFYAPVITQIAIEGND